MDKIRIFLYRFSKWYFNAKDNKNGLIKHFNWFRKNSGQWIANKKTFYKMDGGQSRLDTYSFWSSCILYVWHCDAGKFAQQFAGYLEKINYYNLFPFSQLWIYIFDCGHWQWKIFNVFSDWFNLILRHLDDPPPQD